MSTVLSSLVRPTGSLLTHGVAAKFIVTGFFFRHFCRLCLKQLAALMCVIDKLTKCVCVWLRSS